MPVSLGTTDITKLYLGSTSISKAYLGATEVFSTVSNGLLDNLVSYYKADTSGSFPDAHGSNDGTINGATYTASGFINGAYDFDGSNDYITESVSFSGNFTISCWCKFDSFKSGESQIYRVTGAGSRNIGFSHTGTSSLNTFQLFTNDGTSGSSISLTGFTPVVGVWYLFIAKGDGTTRTFTVIEDDGTKQVGTSTTASSVTLTGTAQIGRHPTVGGRYFDGIFDEEGIWSDAITSDQEDYLYNSGAGLSYDSFTN